MHAAEPLTAHSGGGTEVSGGSGGEPGSGGSGGEPQ